MNELMAPDKYKIVYPESNVTQYKVMISHGEYLQAKAIKDDDEYKAAMRKLTGGKEWFTDESAFAKAITTGTIPWYDGSIHPCIVVPACR